MGKRSTHSTKVQKLRLKTRRAFLRIIFGFLIFIALVSGAVFMATNEKFVITDIKINGNKSIEALSIRQIADELIEQKLLWFLSRDKTFFVPISRIERKILSLSHRVGGAVVTREGLNALNIQIFERVPVYLWCIKDEDIEITATSTTESEEDCYYADHGGYIYSKAPNFSDNIFLKFYSKPIISPAQYAPINTNDLNVGKSIMDKSELDDLVKFVKWFEGKDVKIYSLAIDTEKDIIARVVEGWYIKFDLDALNEAVENTLITLDELLGKEEDLSNLEYIDVRFDNKIFYRLKKH